MSTYVDAVGVIAAWINDQTTGLVGAGNPLQKGATFKHLGGAASAVYALLEELPARQSDSGAEDPDMLAVVSFQVYGASREAATKGAVALAEAITGLRGMPAVVGTAKIWASDDVQGPYWAPDGDASRLIVQATFRLSPVA